MHADGRDRWPDGYVSDNYRELIAGDETTELRAEPPPETNVEARAWSTHLRLLKRSKALEGLQLVAGDIVEKSVNGEPGLFEASSISEDGRINFKGGLGAGAFPDQVTVSFRASDESPEAKVARKTAANRSAHRAPVGDWSIEAHNQLREFEVSSLATPADLEDFERVLDRAEDEAPLQEFLTARPQMLAMLLNGWNRYCIPKPRLGGAFIPDFALCEAHSMGPSWWLVEIETPKSGVVLDQGNQFEKHARDGLAQIDDWREWLQNNLPMARAPKKEHGLGLRGIRPQSTGLVIVGRRHLLKDGNERLRQRLLEERRIHMHTYDWLLDQVAAAIRHQGTPASHAFLLRSTVPQDGDQR